jgi:hypothetical protein
MIAITLELVVPTPPTAPVVPTSISAMPPDINRANPMDRREDVECYQITWGLQRPTSCFANVSCKRPFFREDR